MHLGIPKLCYVCHRTKLAFFTTQELKDQHGDDWNDPLDNAGKPYEDWDGEKKGSPKWKIFYVCYDTSFLNEPDAYGNNNSVDTINAGMAPWLTTEERYKNPDRFTDNPVLFYAGTTIFEFMATMDKAELAYGLPKELKEYLAIKPTKFPKPVVLCPHCKSPIESVLKLSVPTSVFLADELDESYETRTCTDEGTRSAVMCCPTCMSLLG